MSQYRKGSFTSSGTAVSLNLGFVPSKISVYNFSEWGTSGKTIKSEWFYGMPNASALQTITAGTASYITTNGFTPVVLGGDWQNTVYSVTDISNAAPGVVTVASVTPTNSMTLVNGMTFTLSGVEGMTGLNTNRYVVAGISSTTFNLYDTYGNPVDTTALGEFTGTAELNVISYPPTAPVLNPVTGQVVTPGQPAGNQYDIGYEGITLGTSVAGVDDEATNVIYWEAFKDTPTGW